MNLHAIAQGLISAVNPSTQLTIKISAGYTINRDGSTTPNYSLVTLSGDVQGLDEASIRLVDSLNIQGLSRRVWVNGQFNAVVRAAEKGGDIVVTPDGREWKITAVPEGWDTAGWCSFIMTLQGEP